MPFNQGFLVRLSWFIGDDTNWSIILKVSEHNIVRPNILENKDYHVQEHKTIKKYFIRHEISIPWRYSISLNIDLMSIRIEQL